jgi:hypothetical protein
LQRESAQAESAQQESWQQESLAIVSTVSASTAGVVLPPQDAKDTAAKAANMKTNFFIFFV